MSLRLRIVWSLSAVVAPFLLAAVIGLFYLLPSLLAPLETVVGEFVEELEPVRHLQIALLTAAATTRDRGAGGRRQEFHESVHSVERAFASVRSSPLFDKVGRTLVESAWQEWQRARELEKQAVKRHGSVADSEERRQIARHAEVAATMLDVIYFSARKDIDTSRSAAQLAKSRSIWVTLGAIIAACAISIFAAVRFARPVLSDLDELRRGALQLAEGNLAHRVDGFRTPELNELGGAFNAMAGRIETAQEALSELATRDGLTGLLNHREFVRLLSEELERARRYDRPCSLLLIDVDHFKAINDNWGHPAGDIVLRQIAGRIADAIRPADRAARYGGEEFAVLLPETGRESAMSLAERIRSAVASAPMPVSADAAVPVTVSIGLAAYPADGSDGGALIARADAGLYAAKRDGRNRVAISTSMHG